MKNKYIKIALTSDVLLTLEDKKKYIDKLYPSPADYSDMPRNNGVVRKFCKAIGFKDVTFEVNNRSLVTSYHYEEGYISPAEMLFGNLQTPILSFDIIVFYLPIGIQKCSKKKYTYKTRMLATKWANFLGKIFPDLRISLSYIEDKPKIPLEEWVFEEIYSSLHKDINYNIELSIPRKLTQAELDYMTPKLQSLSGDKIALVQYECDTYEECDPNRPIHIEVDYLTWYGKERADV